MDSMGPLYTSPRVLTILHRSNSRKFGSVVFVKDLCVCSFCTAKTPYGVHPGEHKLRSGPGTVGQGVSFGILCRGEHKVSWARNERPCIVGL